MLFDSDCRNVPDHRGIPVRPIVRFCLFFSIVPGAKKVRRDVNVKLDQIHTSSLTRSIGRTTQARPDRGTPIGFLAQSFMK
jgi:hypothetical protein